MSDMMRYMTYESSSEYVPVQREIQYLRNFVHLQLLRMSDKNILNMQIGEVPDHMQIAPMLFILFVENAFKHVTEKSTNAISVKIEVRGAEIYFNCKNRFNKQLKMSKDKTGGIGLANVKRRLELLYPGKHQLLINNDNSFFEVSLTLATDVSELHNN